MRFDFPTRPRYALDPIAIGTMVCTGEQSVVIIALSDIHSETRHFAAMAEALTAADVVFIAGDITHFGGAAGAREVIEDLRLYNPSILAVPGNCDGRGVQEYLACEGPVSYTHLTLPTKRIV